MTPATTTANVSLVIVTHNSEQYLRQCSAGVRSQSARPAGVIVIDNGSSDGSSRLARELFPEATHIANEENRGFAAAANQGISASSGAFVVLLNPDVFLTPEYIERIVKALEAEGGDCGSATGKLLRGIGDNIEPTELIDSKGIRMTRNGRHLDIDAGLHDSEPADQNIREVFGVSGAAAVFRRAYLDDLRINDEVFDEDFFTYREDADLAWRGQLLGWRSLYVPGAVAYHVRRVIPERRGQLPAWINLHSVKNRFLLRLKNQGSYLALRNLPFEFGRDLVVLVATMTVERSSFPAWKWLWHHRKKIMSKRDLIQQRRRRSDRAIAAWFGSRR